MPADNRNRTLRERMELECEIARLKAEVEELKKSASERTAHPPAHQSLQTSEAKYKDLYDHANDIIFTCDLKGNFMTASERAAELFLPPGVAVEELSIDQILAPDSLARAVGLLGRAASDGPDPAGGQPWEFEARSKDGAPVFVEVKTRLIREDGVITGVHGIAREITQRKKLEEEQAKLLSAVERAGEGIFMLNLERCYSYVNEAFGSIYGYTQEELAGKSAATTRSDRVSKEFHDSLWAELVAGNTWCGRQTRKRKDGALVEVETTIAPIRNASGNIIHYVGVDRDITERVQMERRLRETQKMEAIGTLAGGIAHDFNNMLAIIIGNAEIALDDIEEEGPRANLAQILKASKRAKDLTKQILTFSRKAGSGRHSLKLTPLIKETYKLLRGTMPTTIHMDLDIRTDADTVLADPSQMQQVLINLATNAAYAMRKRGGSLTINLDDVELAQAHQMTDSELPAGKYAKLTVADTGSGMTEEVRGRIFEPFFTTKGPSRGTGMGLAVVYGIVKNHGGEIAVESKPGQGSVFSVFLPLSEIPAGGAGQEQGYAQGGKERILLVDDEPSVLQAAAQTLRRLGYTVTSAGSGAEAWQLFQKEPSGFDLVITDQVMPDLTGIRLARKMLKTRRDLPVILFTGYSEATAAEAARAAGIREFVMKPIDKQEAAKTIRRVLDGKGSPRNDRSRIIDGETED